MEYYIKGCKDCPFFLIDTTERCNHPANKKEQSEWLDSYREELHPAWCPLIFEQTTIVLKQN